MKITDLKIKKLRSVYERDADGNRIRKTQEYWAKRPVNVIEGGKRLGHFIIDVIVIDILIFAFEFIVGLFFTPDIFYSFVFTIGFFSIGLTNTLLYPLYYVICEHLWQRTPGKFITKSIVVNEEGEKPDLQTNILRNVIRIVPFEIFSCLSDRGWHDRWLDTYVISEKEHAKIKQLLNEQEEEQ